MSKLTAHPEAILFDKDGTLFDFAASWSGWARAVLDVLSASDEAQARRAAAVIGFDPLRGSFAKDSIVIAATSREVAGALVGVFERSTEEILDILKAEAEKSSQVPVGGVQHVLRALSSNCLLGVVTNDDEATARIHVNELGVSDLFASIIGYDSGFGAKPSPGPLLGFCKTHGVTPERAVMVGDSRHDLDAGRQAGMVTVAVLTGIAERGDLADLADVVLPDVTHIPDWLSGTYASQG